MLLLQYPKEISKQWRIQDFPEVGTPTLQGTPTYDFAKFSQKLHKIERIWTPRVASPAPPLDPPLAKIRAVHKLINFCFVAFLSTLFM